MPCPRSLYLAFSTPSLLHSTGLVSPCQPTFGVSFQPTALNRPRSQPTNFTLSHFQSLSSFFAHAPCRLTLNRLSHAFSNADCYTSERRYKVFAEFATLNGSYLAAGRAHTAKECLMFPKSSRVRCTRRLSTLHGIVLFPAAPTLPTISNRTAHRNMVCNVLNPQADAVPQRQPSHSASPSALVVVPMLRKPQPKALRRPCTQPHILRTPPHPTPLVICPRQPPTTHPLWGAPRPEWRASHISYLGWLSQYCFSFVILT